MKPFVVLIAASLLAGCAGSAPNLVYAAPGVRVIVDYDEPIFYADNFYWRFDGGIWYRSSYYTGGWAYAQPPAVILRIERPQTYVHYRPNAEVARRAPAPAIVREQPRSEPRQVEPIRPPPPAPLAPQPRAISPPRAVQPLPAVAPPPARPTMPPPQGVPPPRPQAAPPQHPGRSDHGQ